MKLKRTNRERLNSIRKHSKLTQSVIKPLRNWLITIFWKMQKNVILSRTWISNLRTCGSMITTHQKSLNRCYQHRSRLAKWSASWQRNKIRSKVKCRAHSKSTGTLYLIMIRMNSWGLLRTIIGPPLWSQKLTTSRPRYRPLISSTHHWTFVIWRRSNSLPNRASKRHTTSSKR